MSIFVCLLVCLWSCCESIPIVVDPKLDNSATGFLKQYGYLQVKFGAIPIGQLKSNQELTDALKTFQRFAHIDDTGIYDEATQRMMKAPRCGLPDIISAEEKAKRKRRFLAQGSKWANKEVTWQLENSNDDGITDANIRSFMTRSLKKWSDQADIDFVELPQTSAGGPPAGSSQIRVRFENGDHGDGFPFDGPSGTLAHAFFPLSNQGLSGDIHFDDAETYTILDPPRSSGQIKFFWVAVHELGHSIGLSHSELFGAVMYPFYLHFPGLDFNLTNDDILGIQSIYGPKPTTPAPVTTTTTTLSTATPLTNGPTPATPPTTPTTTTTTEEPSCITRATAVHLYDGRRPYIFNGRDLYISDDNGTINSMGNGGFLRNVDTLHGKKGNPNLVAFLHEDTFSVYDSRTNRLVSPDRKISDGYQGLPEGFRNVDAAFIFPTNNKLYLFKGDEYWRFTENNALDYILDYDYPKKIYLHWPGVPDNIDAAFVYTNGEVYFFKGDEYYRFDADRLEMREGYPRKNKDGFMQCSPPPRSNMMENLGMGSSSTNLLANQTLVLFLLNIFIKSQFF